MNQQIEGFFLEFTKEEISDIREELSRLDYTPDAKGIKEFFLDAMFNEEEEDDIPASDGVIEKAAKFVRENPEAVNIGLQTIKTLFSKGRK